MARGRLSGTVVYVGLLFPEREMFVCTTKTLLASCLGISVDTLDRRLDGMSSYYGKRYWIWVERVKKLEVRGRGGSFGY
jgi:hypothetical protein